MIADLSKVFRCGYGESRCDVDVGVGLRRECSDRAANSNGDDVRVRAFGSEPMLSVRQKPNTHVPTTI